MARPRRRKAAPVFNAALPATVSRTALLVEGSDAEFRGLIHDLIAYGHRLDTCRDAFAAIVGISGAQYEILMLVSRAEGLLAVGEVAARPHRCGCWRATSSPRATGRWRCCSSCCTTPRRHERFLLRALRHHGSGRPALRRALPRGARAAARALARHPAHPVAYAARVARPVRRQPRPDHTARTARV